jgi:hypothetical protein
MNTSFSTLGPVYELQQELSRAQAIPVAGLVVSGVKSTLSLVEIVVGIAATIFFSSLAIVSGFTFNKSMRSFSDCMTNYGSQSLLHVGLGISSFIYSGINIASLGLAAYTIERVAS